MTMTRFRTDRVSHECFGSVGISIRVLCWVVLSSTSILLGTRPAEAECLQYSASFLAFAVGSGPAAVAIGDFNGDGLLDLATANQSAHSASVLLATPDGRFAGRIDYAVGVSPNGIAAGDLNGDGILDLVTANHGSSSISILAGVGAGAFAGKVDMSTDVGPIAVALGDLDADGVLDIVVACDVSNSMSIFLGEGNGTFSGSVSYVTPASPYFATISDINSDGEPDILLANSGPGISVWLGLGNGNVLPRTTFPTSGQSRCIGVGDFNRDGKPDLVSANHEGTATVLRGYGDGNFAAPTLIVTGFLRSTAVVAADVDSDGKVDFAVSGFSDPSKSRVVLLRGLGDGTFAPNGDFVTSNSPSALAVGDLNGDGALDLAVANLGSDNVAILQGTGTGSFGYRSEIPTAAPYVMPIATAVADINLDGALDLVVANVREIGAGSVSVLTGIGDGLFSPKLDYWSLASQSPQSVAIGDLNGDAWPDLVICDGGDGVVARVGTGNGAFGDRTSVTGGGRAVVLGDFNEDGFADAVGTGGGDGLYVSLGMGDGQFLPYTWFSVGGGAISVASGDLNGDGHLDLATPKAGSGIVSVFFGDGQGHFGPRTDFDGGQSALVMAIADLDADGAQDIAVANTDQHAISVLLGIGDGTFHPRVAYPTGRSPGAIAVADIDGDGIADLIAANRSDNSVSILLGNGDGSYMPRQDFGVGRVPYSISIGDLNGDGLLDLACANAGSEGVSVLRRLPCGLLDVGAKPGGSNFRLGPAIPNPSASGVDLKLVLPEPRAVDAGVYDVSGRKIAAIVSGRILPAGVHTLFWNSRSDDGAANPAGIYFLRVRAGSDVAVARIVRIE